MPLLPYLRFFRRTPPRRPHPRRTPKPQSARLGIERLEQRELLSCNVISGYVYHDANNNGRFDAGERPLAGSRIELRNAGNVVVGTAVTAANGHYRFAVDSTLSTAATTLTRTLTFAATPTDWTQTGTVPQFDPALGTLTAVEIVNAGTITSQIKVESLDQAPSTITATVSGVLTLSGPGVPALATNSAAPQRFAATAYDGTFDFSGTSGHDFGPQTATGSRSLRLTAAADLARYTGRGTVAFTETAQATSAGSGAGNLLTQINTTALAQVSVIYHYLPSNCLRPGSYTLVQTGQPPGYLDGLDSRNGVVLANSTGSDVIPLTLAATNLVNNNFGERLPPPVLVGTTTYCDSFVATPAEFADPQERANLVFQSKLLFLDSTIRQTVSGDWLVQLVWLDGVYRQLLGRPVDPSGLAYWMTLMQAGVSRQQVVHSLWTSPEHRGRQVDQFYETFLHRAADPGGRQFFVSLFQSGASETDVARFFLTSGEYTATHADPVAFVAGLYADVLGRSFDADGLQYWQAALQSGVSRAAVAQAFLTSGEAYGRLVDCYYLNLFDRSADPAGRQYWVSVLQSGAVTPAAIGELFLASGEFYDAARRASTA